MGVLILIAAAAGIAIIATTGARDGGGGVRGPDLFVLERPVIMKVR